MIVRCPACSSRRDIPDLEEAAGIALVDCQHCGHDWIEGMALPAAVEQQPLLAGFMSDASAPMDHLLEAARAARRQFQSRRRKRYRRIASWGAIGALALFPICAAAAFPEQVVAVLPATVDVYDWAGQNVNIIGIDIRQVSIQHLIVDGRQVIAVKGELTNNSTTIRKIPWLRFGLRTKDDREVYHWTLDTQVRPLKPGESTSFVTRLASPPEAARNLEIRFAHADEIGKTASP